MSALLPAKVLSVSLASAVIGGSLAGFAFSSEPPAPAPPRAAAETMRAPLPPGSIAPGAAGVEATAQRLAHALDAVPMREGGDEQERFCPQDRLRVRWSAPTPGEFTVGGHVAPVGPSPVAGVHEVNGLVVCEGVSYAYMGFEARWDGRAWKVAAVPSLSDEHDLDEEHAQEPEHEEEAEEPAHEARETAEVAPQPRRVAAPPASSVRGFTVPSLDGIDRYASYDPQRVCDPVGKPGMLALRDLLLRTYPGTRSLGVSRTCTARGVSEHKEGRAFDWGVNAWVPSERAAAQSVLAQLLATDEAGNRHALARRLGVMYVIWDSKIWSAYSADRGWRAYGGANPHTDHVHISLSWAGAMGRTSYWQGSNASLLAFDPELRLVDSVAAGTPIRTGGTTTTAAGQDERASRRREDEARPERTGRPGREAARADREAAEDPRHEAAQAEQRAQREVRKAAQRQAREIRKAAQRAERAARRATATPAPEPVVAVQAQPTALPAAAKAVGKARAAAAHQAQVDRAAQRAADRTARAAAKAAKAAMRAKAAQAAKATDRAQKRTARSAAPSPRSSKVAGQKAARGSNGVGTGKAGKGRR